MAVYATLTDLYNYGLPQASFGTLTTMTQQAALDAQNDEADNFFRARYKLPFLPPIPVSVTRNVAIRAAFDLMNIRGYNPASGADVNLAMRNDMAIAWFKDVQRQTLHPNFIESTSPTPAIPDPTLFTNASRNWDTPGNAV